MRKGVLGLLLCFSGSVVAGGSPETTLLVVDAASPSSLAVANAYRELRDLPERQILWLDGVPPVHTIDVETFRQQILAPVERHLAATGLHDEIDLIAYSAGFPYAVNYRADERAAGLTPSKYRAEAGSLTGMTFFGAEVGARGLGYFSPTANPYFRRPLAQPAEALGLLLAEPRATDWTFESTTGFRAHEDWSRDHARVGAVGNRVRLAVMLGYTGHRGNSVPEIRDYLERAVASDGTHPSGTVYLMANRNIRGRVRAHLFPSTVAALAARGRRAEILTQGGAGQDGWTPRGRPDVIGLVAGTRKVAWAASGSLMLPGAVAESFTSYAGHFEHASQTKLSEYLRQGAAGSSGAVREPFSFVEKFPLPQLHVYYADGSSLAEAYYQSVASPYQLLVVGDPLARPFASFAEVELASPSPAVPWRGSVELVPAVRPAPGHPIAHVELWVDGRPMGEGPPGRSIPLDTRALADGHHEVRLVAVEAGAIATRSYVRVPIEVDNGGRHVSVTHAPHRLRYGELVRIHGRADGARSVTLRQGTRQLERATLDGGAWTLEVASEKLGPGLVHLYPVAHFPDGEARGEPLRMRILDPSSSPAVALPDAAEEGVAVVVEGAGDVLAGTAPGLVGRLPRELRVRRPSEIRARGFVEVRAAGLYEMTVEGSGRLELSMGEAFRRQLAIPKDDGAVRVPIALAVGWHPFELRLIAPASDRLRVLLGGPEPTFALTGGRVRHHEKE